MSFSPSFPPGKVVHLRCLGDAASAPWLVIDPKTHRPMASPTPDAGWIPHIDVHLSRFRLESVAAAAERKKRFLIATPGSR